MCSEGLLVNRSEDIMVIILESDFQKLQEFRAI